MEGEVLRDDQWEQVKPFVPGDRKGKRGPRSDGRHIIEWLHSCRDEGGYCGDGFARA